MLDGMTVAVTGAYGNLGKAVAARLATDGANLILVGRRQDALDAAFPGEEPKRVKVAVDLLDEAATAEAFRAAAARFGGIDGLCAIAGGFDMGTSVHETPAEAWERMFDLNVRTLLSSVRAIVPAMVERGRGRIVTIGAQGAMRGGAKMGPYAAAKSSVMRITESMAAELGPSGVTANCVMPSIIDTPENRKAMPKADPAKWVGPEDIAATIAFLLSPAANAVNGALIPVTG
jgi:NAD(P)-dependent dehydrogenase (short-subunit alcohol dehydrogenase family)